MRLTALLIALATALLFSTGSASAVTGKATWFQDKGLGACGTPIDATSQMLVAVPEALWTTSNPNKDPLCKKKVKVTYKGKTITLPIKDQCPSRSCGSKHIDLSQPAFKQFANLSKGIIEPLTWQVV